MQVVMAAKRRIIVGGTLAVEAGGVMYIVVKVGRIWGSANECDLGVWLWVREKHRALFVGCIAARPASGYGGASASANVSSSMLGELAAFLGRLETDCLVLGPVAWILHALLAAHE